MDFLGSVISLTLLFTPLDNFQQNIFENICGVEDYREEASLEKQNLSELFLSVADSISFEEIDSELGNVFENSEEINNAVEIIKEKNFISNNLKLRLMEFESEIFSTEYRNDLIINVNANEDTFEQLVYENYRLCEKTVWKNNTDLSQIKLLYRYIYDYEENGYTIICEDFVNNFYIVSEYNEKSLCVKKNIYSLFAEKNEKYLSYVKPSVNGSLLEQDIFEYTENNLLERESLNYYKDELRFLSKSTVYYSNEFSDLNFMYYENDVLRIEVEYSAENLYTQNVYLSKDYKVATIFENDIKVSEVIYLNDKILRSTNFNE